MTDFLIQYAAVDETTGALVTLDSLLLSVERYEKAVSKAFVAVDALQFNCLADKLRAERGYSTIHHTPPGHSFDRVGCFDACFYVAACQERAVVSGPVWLDAFIGMIAACSRTSTGSIRFGLPPRRSGRRHPATQRADRPMNSAWWDSLR
jgi:hypothetical protein